MEFTCQHCGKVSTARGTHGGCFACGKVMSTADGRVDRDALDRRMKAQRTSEVPND